MDFKEQRVKSRNLHQYTCCQKRWWGDATANICGICRRRVDRLPLNKMIGIVWFKCKCGRKYAGFSRGDVTSKCHGCHAENLPSFILPGDKANKNENSDKKHFCSACKGSNDCPVIAEYQSLKNKNVSSNTLYSYKKNENQSIQKISNKNTLANAKKYHQTEPYNNQKETINTWSSPLIFINGEQEYIPPLDPHHHHNLAPLSSPSPNDNPKEIRSYNNDIKNSCDGDDKGNGGYFGTIMMTIAITIIVFMVFKK